jgi:transmembrane sensor
MRSTDPDPAEAVRLREASDWWLRLQDDCGAEQAGEWLAWCQQDRSNLDAFERIEATAFELRGLSSTQRDELAQEFAPLERGALPKSSVTWQRWGAIAAAVVLGVGVTVLGVRLVHDNGIARGTVYITDHALREDVALIDGSHVSIGAKSSVSVRMQRRERLVQLEQGEAYFEVAQDPVRPFIVHSGDLTITALGTAFDVRTGAGNVAISVTEGRVRVADRTDSAFEVAAGERATYSSASGRFKMSAVSREQSTSWREGRLEFINEPLAMVIASINRYASPGVSIADPEAARLTFTGTVKPDDLSAWLTALPHVLPVQVTRTQSGLSISSAR